MITPHKAFVMPPPGPHGGDAPALARALGVPVEEILDLSASMNPLAPDVTPMICRHAVAARTYPDAHTATAALAQAIGVDSSRVLLTNGGSEAIALVAYELGVARVVEPEFSLWRRHLSAVHNDESPGIGRVRSNPNNPSGRMAADGEEAAVWDEAFYPLATGEWTRGDADQGALVVGSLTKIFSCPGLRLGYILGPGPEAIHRIRQRQPTWSVNSLALAVLPELLTGTDLRRWSAGIAELRAALSTQLRARDLEVDAGAAPWVLVHNAAWLRPALAAHGILVRDCASFGLGGTVRIAVPSPANMARLMDALTCLGAP